MATTPNDGKGGKDQQHKRQAHKDSGNDAKDGNRQQISSGGNHIIAIYTRPGNGTDYKTIRICHHVKAL